MELPETPILFPVAKKDYTNTPFIRQEWRCLRHHLKNAFMLTLFGYGAPSSDVEAVSLMKEAWQGNTSFKIAETEIIDIKDKAVLEETWSPLIFSHHYMTTNDFQNSWIANHPRRSCEAMYNVTVKAKFVHNNPMPRGASFKELYSWLQPLLRAEQMVKSR